jgi:hypothetical protein
MPAQPQAMPPPPSETPKPNPSAPTGFGLLAQRVSSWTTKAVLTALILVAGLGFGRQVLQWWKGDTSIDIPLPSDGLGDLGRVHEIQVGSGTWSIRRQSLAGTRQQALETLRVTCREVTESAVAPVEWLDAPERNLLDSLQERPPAEREPGKWGVYQWDQAFPLVVGVREIGSEPGAKAAQKVAASGPRVVTWGLAVPMSQGAWTLYIFHPTGPSSGPQPGPPELPMPPASRRILALQVAGGGSITAFAGPAQPETWKRCFDRWFETRGWAAAGNWDHAGSRWSRCYVEKTEGPAARADVQLAADGSGGMSGLLLVTPPAAQTTESKSP